MRSVVWLSEATLGRCQRSSPRFSAPHAEVVTSTKQFLAAAQDPQTLAYVDGATLAILAAIDHVPLPSFIIAICDDTLQTAVGWLQYPWLSHVLSITMLEHPMAERHLDNVVRTLTNPNPPRLLDWIEGNLTGRRIRLTHASTRATQLEKMGEFFEAKGIGGRTRDQLRDIAEELLTNAFYDAPVAAGALKKPVSRTHDVSLPDDSACDLVYGSHDDEAVIRVRDPFGSLSRRRLVEVLGRCSRTDMQVQVDESMGGAGLGLWRIFAVASFVTISVVKNHHTEFLVGIAKRAAATKPFAFHLYFRDGAKPRFWRTADEDSSKPSVNKSVTIQVAKSD
ncbi:MAG: hypothetical protein ABI867_16065 [Kofleriaceae bacterium]